MAVGYVDILVGGQYGSEGKGQIASYISKEYDVLVRTGGPNAGHTVLEPSGPYTYHYLPSGTMAGNQIIVMGPGSLLNIHGAGFGKGFLHEVADKELTPDRLVVDRQAMIITAEDVESEEGIRKGIGSTKQGVGAAAARRITNRSRSTKLARDIKELSPYVGDSLSVLNNALTSGKRVLIEGTQGTALSLYHGFYPYVTSRDTSASSLLSESGIAPRWVRKVLMVCRTYPIRVQSPKGGTSGPMVRPVGWKEVSRRSGLDYKTLLKRERTSTTNRRRRVSEFDWDLLRRSSVLNGATDIALTFVDYLGFNNRMVKEFSKLDDGVVKFVDKVELVSGARVSMVSVGFGPDKIIDRRNWEEDSEHRLWV